MPINSMIVEEPALLRMGEKLENLSDSLSGDFRKAEEYIHAVHSSGWDDENFKNLLGLFDASGQQLIKICKLLKELAVLEREQARVVEQYLQLRIKRQTDF